MKAFLDSTKCSGYGACADTCPSVFEIDEFGFGALIGDGTVPAGNDEGERQGSRGGRLPPKHAITLRD